jgi:hypothetical protein
MVRRFCIPFLLLFLSGTAISYELAQFDFIGFSADGRYLAWEEYGIQDVTGYPYSTISIVDTAVDSVVAVGSGVFEQSVPDITPGQNIRGIFDEYLDSAENEYRYWEERARGIAMAQVEGLAGTLGIIPGNCGRLVLHHPMTDRTNYSASIQFVTGWDGPWYKTSPQFEVLLEQEEIPDTTEHQEHPFLNVLLTVKLQNTTDRTQTVLLDEKSAGTPTMDAFTYGVRSVYVYRDSVVAIVLYRYMNGQDGPDVHYRMIAGGLPFFEPAFRTSTGG